jgi:hypothetical protein
MRVKVTGIDATMKSIRAQIKAQTKAKLPGVASNLIDALHDATPKDTGHAANSWRYEIVGDKAVITNPVDYIDDLNRGSSQQAPAFFIEKTILENKDVVPVGAIVSYR